MLAAAPIGSALLRLANWARVLQFPFLPKMWRIVAAMLGRKRLHTIECGPESGRSAKGWRPADELPRGQATHLPKGVRGYQVTDDEIELCVEWLRPLGVAPRPSPRRRCAPCGSASGLLARCPPCFAPRKVAICEPATSTSFLRGGPPRRSPCPAQFRRGESKWPAPARGRSTSGIASSIASIARGAVAQMSIKNLVLRVGGAFVACEKDAPC